MKYGFTFLSLFLILFVCIHTQNAFSQNTTSQPSFDVQGAIDNLFNPETGLPNGIEEQITITQIPKVPQPGQQVNVQISGYTTNLNKALITWTIDGENKLSNTGATNFTFNAPSSGDSLNLVIKIQKENGGTISKTITINPADVDLIYEAQTYAHPFYQGKKIYTSESVIKFIAIPNFVSSGGQKIPASNLVYTWKINGVVQPADSGYARNTFLFKGPLIERGAQITVEVSAIGSNLKATQTIGGIRSTPPDVVLYENNPLLGIVYEKAIEGTFVLDRPQVDFEAVPYFFSTNFKNSNDVEYKWSINGIQVTAKAPNENYMVLQNQKNESGQANIAVSAEHSQNILQTTRNSVQLNFNKIENLSNEEFAF